MRWALFYLLYPVVKFGVLSALVPNTAAGFSVVQLEKTHCSYIIMSTVVFPEVLKH